jgi:hypothetical protein
MSNDDDPGGLEELAKHRHEFALCRAIQKLSPVGGPLLCGSRRVDAGRPAAVIDEGFIERPRQDDV